jgi:hypothetical protein
VKGVAAVIRVRRIERRQKNFLEREGSLYFAVSEIRCLVDVPGQKLPSVGNGDMTHYLKTVVAPQVFKLR